MWKLSHFGGKTVRVKRSHTYFFPHRVNPSRVRVTFFKVDVESMLFEQWWKRRKGCGRVKDF